MIHGKSSRFNRRQRHVYCRIDGSYPSDNTRCRIRISDSHDNVCSFSVIFYCILQNEKKNCPMGGGISYYSLYAICSSRSVSAAGIIMRKRNLCLFFDSATAGEKFSPAYCGIEHYNDK